MTEYRQKCPYCEQEYVTAVYGTDASEAELTLQAHEYGAWAMAQHLTEDHPDIANLLEGETLTAFSSYTHL